VLYARNQMTKLSLNFEYDKATPRRTPAWQMHFHLTATKMTHPAATRTTAVLAYKVKVSFVSCTEHCNLSLSLRLSNPQCKASPNGRDLFTCSKKACSRAAFFLGSNSVG